METIANGIGRLERSLQPALRLTQPPAVVVPGTQRGGGLIAELHHGQPLREAMSDDEMRFRGVRCAERDAEPKPNQAGLDRPSGGIEPGRESVEAAHGVIVPLVRCHRRPLELDERTHRDVAGRVVQLCRSRERSAGAGTGTQLDPGRAGTPVRLGGEGEQSLRVAGPRRRVESVSGLVEAAEPGERVGEVDGETELVGGVAPDEVDRPTEPCQALVGPAETARRFTGVASDARRVHVERRRDGERPHRLELDHRLRGTTQLGEDVGEVRPHPYAPGEVIVFDERTRRREVIEGAVEVPLPAERVAEVHRRIGEHCPPSGVVGVGERRQQLLTGGDRLAVTAEIVERMHPAEVATRRVEPAALADERHLGLGDQVERGMGIALLDREAGSQVGGIGSLDRPIPPGHDEQSFRQLLCRRGILLSEVAGDDQQLRDRPSWSWHLPLAGR